MFNLAGEGVIFNFFRLSCKSHHYQQELQSKTLVWFLAGQSLCFKKTKLKQGMLIGNVRINLLSIHFFDKLISKTFPLHFNNFAI